MASLLIGSGCESAPVRAIQGARHYSDGTRALHQGRETRAIEELEQAAILVPHASEVQNHLGLAYWSDGRTLDARVAFERAIELDCDNMAARENLDRLMGSHVVPGDPGDDSSWKGDREGG